MTLAPTVLTYLYVAGIVLLVSNLIHVVFTVAQYLAHLDQGVVNIADVVILIWVSWTGFCRGVWCLG